MKLSEIYEQLVDDGAPVAFRAYDGSSAGPRDAAMIVEVRSPRAPRYIATAPGELGLCRAYITGAVEIHGDLHDVLVALLAHRRPDLKARRFLKLLPKLGLGTLRPPPIPPEEAPPRWRRGLRRHSKTRDAAAIEHHYGISNRFYELLLGPTMTYSCAVFATEDATLDAAQTEKVDLICRKLDLQPDQRLLDVGAGWGTLVRHAAEHYGVRALGVTLAAAQTEWATQAIDEAGLRGRAEVRNLDYRDLSDSGFDAVSSVGTMEHIGSAELGGHFTALAGKLRPGGRMLNHTITRWSNVGATRIGQFNDRYVFPDGELQGPGTVMSAMHDHGFEVRHTENLREHYGMTLREWGRNLERNWGTAVALVGERRARAWRLYMAISRVAFETNRVQIHQMLGVRVHDDGRSGMPLRPGWEGATSRRPTESRQWASRSRAASVGAPSTET